MLTPKQFESIGRLTLAFNEIEEMISIYLPYILQNPEWNVSLLIAEGETFSRKLEFFKKVLAAIADERPIAEVQTKAVQDLLDKAKRIADKRNYYVHAIGFIDFTKNERMLRSKRGVSPVDESEIFTLAAEASDIARACFINRFSLTSSTYV